MNKILTSLAVRCTTITTASARSSASSSSMFSHTSRSPVVIARIQTMQMHSSAVRYMSEASSPSGNASTADIAIPYFKATVDEQVLPAVSLATAANQEIVQHKKSLAVAKYRKHATDTGSAPVQIATMTEDVFNLARHALQHKKDKHSMRGYQILLARRKKMMIYLKRKDLQLFKETVAALGLENEAKHIK